MGERGVISERGRGTGGWNAICMPAAHFLGDFRWPLGDVEAGEGVASADGGTGSNFRAREGDEEARVAGTRFGGPVAVFMGISRGRWVTSRLGEEWRVQMGERGVISERGRGMRRHGRRERVFACPQLFSFAIPGVVR